MTKACDHCFSLINIQWAQRSFKPFGLSFKSPKTICRKHETVLEARKVWQILVASKVSVGWDHADIQDDTVWLLKTAFSCVYMMKFPRNEASKTERFSLFFACIRAIIDWNSWENAVQRAASMSSTSTGQEWPWKSKTVQQITLDLFQNCDVPEEFHTHRGLRIVTSLNIIPWLF